MLKQKKGEYGYLDGLKKWNLTKMLIGFGVVLAVLLAGILIFKSRTNYLTVLSVVLVLPAAKLAVDYICLVPHKPCSEELKLSVEAASKDLSVVYDCVVSNSKKPIGTQAVVITDSVICALTNEEKADKKLFETSVCDFLKADKLNVTVTLYTDEKTFLNRVKNLSANFEKGNTNCMDRMEWNTTSFTQMCL